MRESNPRKEKSIGESERIDLLLGDQRSGAAIEMKVRLKAGGIRNLHGQALYYAQAFKGRGPLLLVLCRTSPEIRLQLSQLVATLRGQGFGVLAVLAAPGRS